MKLKLWGLELGLAMGSGLVRDMIGAWGRTGPGARAVAGLGLRLRMAVGMGLRLTLGLRLEQRLQLQ